MPGSSTTPGRTDARTIAPVRVAFRPFHSVGTRNHESFAARWLAYALPCRRFACTFTGTCARLRADAVRYTFIVGRDRGTARATLGNGLAVSAFPLYVPV